MVGREQLSAMGVAGMFIPSDLSDHATGMVFP